MDQRDPIERNGDLSPPATTVGGWLTQNALSLVVLAAIVAFVCIKLDPVTVALVAIGLGLVIFIHELGHFMAAKWCDVHVETFSIGFGPPLPGCRFRRGETAYQIALVPLGGYVKMVGEGNEEEGEDDPRSFKNKTVGQRMLIISAGVIMNILLAGGCFVGVYMATGVDRPAGVIGSVDAGSPAWQKGLRPGDQLLKIGGTDRPLFDDVMPEVMHSKPGVPIPVTYEKFEGGKVETVVTEVVPRKNLDRGRPMIGIGPARAASLIPPSRKKLPPYVPGTVAANADPPLRNGDRIVGSTDPNQSADAYDPNRTAPLPEDPRDPGSGHRDYFELSRRLTRLAGREVVLQVQPEHTKNDAPPDSVRIPPAFQTSYGVRLGMGPITALRENSPAARAGIQIRTAQETGDTIFEVEVADTDGTVHRFASDPGAKGPGNGDVTVLDPARLPEQLRQWADRRGPGPKTVKLRIKRKAGHNVNGQDVDVMLNWDDSWRDEPSVPSSEGSPRAIDGLGLAYAIKTQVDAVTPDLPAAKAVVAKDGKLAKGADYPLHKGDVIKSVRFFLTTADGAVEPDGEIKLGPDQGAYGLWWAEEVAPARRLGLVIQRGDDETVEVTLEGVPDKARPQVHRGILFESDTRLEKADSLVQAIGMGVHHTWSLIVRIYQNLGAMAGGNISFAKNASGPLDIAAVSYSIAGESLPMFVLFIGMISVNLAVINFLPIPVLDGGHMVFLAYEWLRGRPAPEAIRVAATFVGLAMIASLMLFVIFLDVQKRL
ncbi:MAG TPA: site-2 protease family protein [Gemmataceae bacterium]|nr:site-2 protease family protein [Gemmataceae bacterium]